MYKFKNTFLLTKSLFCPICQNILDNPIFYPCEHVFCKQCNDIYFSKLKIKSCSICRNMTNKNNIKPELYINNIIETLELYCKNRSYGCNWEGIKRNLNNHLKECKFENATDDIKKILIKNNNCNEVDDNNYFGEYTLDKKIEEEDEENDGDLFCKLYNKNLLDDNTLKLLLEEKTINKNIKTKTIDNLVDDIFNEANIKDKSKPNLKKKQKKNKNNKKIDEYITYINKLF